MLLLVLILVLIAFVLLVVALLSSSVLWAWISVVVSLAAAGALVVDWLQRRNAVRAGAAPVGGSATGQGVSAAPRPEPEAVTELLPVLSKDSAPEDRPNVVSAVQETVAIDVVKPSGSDERPSSAVGTATPSGGFSSHTVTKSGFDDALAGPSDDAVGRAADAHLVEPDGSVATTAGGTSGTSGGEAPRTEDGPEEASDPAAAALVAGLDDEVLVVDEHPRYHVAGCETLSGTPTIPLPASEAVELGFTPCGVCVPDRTLASRHTAPSSR